MAVYIIRYLLLTPGMSGIAGSPPVAIRMLLAVYSLTYVHVDTRTVYNDVKAWKEG